jgi:hydroxymethylglutaryl-CoA lyase
MSQVTIIEVGPRDGLQNELQFVPTEKKVELIHRLCESGIRRVEAVSFVHPNKVPQMADAEEVMKALSRIEGVAISALIPNEIGFERALGNRIKEVNWVTSASETFNQKNINQSIEENFIAFKRLVPRAKQAGVKLRFSVSMSFECPYEGNIKQDNVRNLVNRAIEAGADEVGIADTIGVAVPDQVNSLCSTLVKDTGSFPLAVHLHDTRGLALANTYAAHNAGIRMFESSIGGLGGCPFAPGAAGNAATEDVVHMFEKMNIDTGIDLSKLLDASDFAVKLSQREPLGRIRTIKDRETLLLK